MRGVFFYSEKYNRLTIKDSIFENIKIDKPLIHNNELILK